MKRLLLFVAMLHSSLGILHSQVPNLMSYQGRVAVGTVNFHGTGLFKFALVNGTGPTLLWKNDGSSGDTEPADAAAVSLIVAKGLYSVLLGDTSLANMTAIPGTVWANPDVRLRVWFSDGTPNGFQLLTPDQRLTPNGYSLNATNISSGTLADARLSANIPRLDASNTFTNHLFVGNNFTVPYRGSSTGVNNTFLGTEAGAFNTTGQGNTILGRGCFFSNTTGSFNTALGYSVLQYSTTGSSNTGVGNFALTNTTAGDNTALGANALRNVTSGSNNIGIGSSGGVNLSTGSNNIDIGHQGVAGESNIIRIGTTQTDTYLTGVIHGNGSGLTNLPNPASATNFTGSLAGDVTGTQSATTVATVGGVSAANVASGANLANAATSANTASTIVKRDASGNFTAGTITAALNGNASTATSATNFTGSLAGNVTGTQGATVVATVGGVTAANVASGANLANAATSANTASTIVARNASGNFSAGTITAALNGNASTATSATSFTGSLAGEVTGTQGSTAIAATTVTGKLLTGFSTTAGVITASDSILTAINKLNGNVALKAPLDSPYFTTTLRVGSAFRVSDPYQNTGSFNLFAGALGGASNTSGDYNTALGPAAMYSNTTGTKNVAIGYSTLFDNTTGSSNIAIGYGAGSLITGSNNIDIGNNGVATDSGVIRLGTAGTHASTLLVGKVGIGTDSPITDLTVVRNMTKDDYGSARTFAVTTNDANGFGLDIRLRGHTLPSYRSVLMQTGEMGLADGGVLFLQPYGGTVTIGGDNQALAAYGKLVVSGSTWLNAGNIGGGSTDTYFYGGSSTGSVSNWGGGNVSIYATDHIVAFAYLAFSDERLKIVGGRSDCRSDLDTLLGIEITDYFYKDTVARGHVPQKKVIAQQVERVFPQAVSKRTGVVPDIFKKGMVDQGWILLTTDLKVGDRVRLVDEQNAESVTSVVEISKDGFRTESPPKGNQIFVYGREVKDFRTVDYEAISMLNVSATQELAKKIDAKDAEIAALKKQLADQAAAMKALAAKQTARDEALEARLIALERANGAATSVKVALKK